jgi:hypothetical protein
VSNAKQLAEISKSLSDLGVALHAYALVAVCTETTREDREQAWEDALSAIDDFKRDWKPGVTQRGTTGRPRNTHK